MLKQRRLMILFINHACVTRLFFVITTVATFKLILSSTGVLKPTNSFFSWLLLTSLIPEKIEKLLNVHFAAEGDPTVNDLFVY